MNQSNVIFAFLTIAFIVFITMRGELGTYMGFFFASGATAPGSPKSDDKKAADASGNLDSAKVAQAAQLALMFI